MVSLYLQSVKNSVYNMLKSIQKSSFVYLWKMQKHVIYYLSMKYFSSFWSIIYNVINADTI
jgi:hypothetical protein